MFWKNVQRRYALTDNGIRNIKKGTAWTVIVNLIVISGMSILYTLMSGLMDTLTKGAPLPNALVFTGITAVFLLISYLAHLQQYKATYGLVYGEVKNARLGLAERLRRLPLGYFGKRDLADLTETLMGDVNRLEHVWSHCLSYLYGSWISTTLIAAGMLIYNWKLALACLWGVPVAFILLFGSRKVHKAQSENHKKAAVQVADGIQETLENIREIRATNREDRFLEELNGKIDRSEKVQIKGELTIGIFVNLAGVIMRLGVATTILTGTGMILSGQIDFMQLFMFLLAITRVYAPFDQALALIAEMFVSQVSAGRLREVQETPTAEGSEVFMPKGHDIEFRNVSFAYDNQEVLNGVSFTAREGEVTALVGPSGSGKSTCARLAARLWDADRGEILVGGVDIEGIDPEVLLSDYSMVLANCDEFVDKLPNGYATPIGENGAKLSGGERQRISIARALLKNAPIVLLDEATASLDVENETKVQGALSRLLTGKTVLVIAHRMRTVEAADKIVVLADGKVAEEGSPAELLKKEDGLFRRMTRLQTAGAEWSI